MIKDMEQGIESRIRVTVKHTRSKFQDFSMKTFLSRYFDRLTGEARPGWVCGWSQASPCQELDWQGVRSFQPSEFYRDRSFLLERQLFLLQNFKFSGGTSSHILSLPHSLEVIKEALLTAMACLEYREGVSSPDSASINFATKMSCYQMQNCLRRTHLNYSHHLPVSVPASLSSVHAVESLADKASSRNNFEPICNAFSLQGCRFSKAVNLFNQFLRMVISYLLLASK